MLTKTDPDPVLTYDRAGGVIRFTAAGTTLSLRVAGDGANLTRTVFRSGGDEVRRSALSGKDLAAFDSLVRIVVEAGGSFVTR